MKLSLGFRQSPRLPSDSFTPKEIDPKLLQSLEPPPGVAFNKAQLHLSIESLVVKEIPHHEYGIGRVKYRGDGCTWNASYPLPIKLPIGTRVKVVGRIGLTLIVKPFDDNLQENQHA
ncbi:MAG: NfeD family protein [Leptolyngbyaceae cyanobacterium]